MHQGFSWAERGLALAGPGQSYGPMFDEKLTVAAWKTKPSWAIISANDPGDPPAMEESAANAYCRNPNANSAVPAATVIYCLPFTE